MKRSLATLILLSLFTVLFQSCSSHSTNIERFRAPGATGKAVYPSEEFEEKNSKY